MTKRQDAINKTKRYPIPKFRQHKGQTERDINCEQYIFEILEIIYSDDYFDTRLSKASRIAFVAKTWGSIGTYHGLHQWCSKCGEQKKHDDLHNEGFQDSKLLCADCKKSIV